MEASLRLKFTQHPDLKALLLGTGDADLIEVRASQSSQLVSRIRLFQDSPRDYFWGIGADHSGRNELGKALVRLREELRQEQDNPTHIPTARRDATRLSVQDLTSLAGVRSSVGSILVSASGPPNSSPQDSGLCEVRPCACCKVSPD